MATFGKSSGTNQNPGANLNSGRLYGFWFTLPEAGTVTDLSTWGRYGTATQVFRLALYDDDGAGKANILKGVTAEFSVDASYSAYQEFKGAITPVALSAGNYWICQWVGPTTNGFSASRDAATGATNTGYKDIAYNSSSSPGDIAGTWAAYDWGTRWLCATYSTGSPPTLTTETITAITASTATSGGHISDDGGATITAYGVCWNTTGAPTIADSHTTDGP